MAGGILKRADLVHGQRYVIIERTKGYGCPSTIGYRRVHLVELQSNNKALVAWDMKTGDRHLGLPDRKIVTRMMLRVVSCSLFLATEADWDAYGHEYSFDRKHCVVSDPPPGVDTLVGQTSL